MLATLHPEVTLKRAQLIHRRAITLDTHVDIDRDHFTLDQPNYVSGLDDTQVDLPSMEAGGLDAAFFSVFQGQRDDFTPAGYVQAYNTAMDKVLAIRRLTSELAPDRIGITLTAADVRRIAGEGRLVALVGMENGYALCEDAQNVRRFAELGVRYLSLAHNGNTVGRFPYRRGRWLPVERGVPSRTGSHRRGEPVGNGARHLPSLERGEP